MQGVPLQNKFSFSNPDSSITGLSEKKLCIEVGHFFTCFTISDLSGRQIIDFVYFESFLPVDFAEINVLLSHEKLNGVSFSDVVLVHNRLEMALVPSSIYKPELSSTILETIHGDLIPLEIIVDDVHQWELHNIYGWKPELLTLISSKFPQVRNIQFSTSALRSLFKTLSFEKEQWMKVYFYKNAFHLLVLKDNQLELSQTFNFETPQDIIYHLLNVVDRLKLDLASISVEVSGLLDTQSETWSEFNKFFVTVSLEACPSIDNSSNSEDHLPSHYYTPFLITPRCV
jgi:hypothetical protein